MFMFESNNGDVEKITGNIASNIKMADISLLNFTKSLKNSLTDIQGVINSVAGYNTVAANTARETMGSTRIVGNAIQKASAAAAENTLLLGKGVEETKFDYDKKGHIGAAVKILEESAFEHPEVFNRELVKKGDSYFIPAGKVHAIGAGVLAAEIQQTSDITYRVYDWDRIDNYGEKRELHIDLAAKATKHFDSNGKLNYNIQPYLILCFVLFQKLRNYFYQDYNLSYSQ